MYLIPRFWSIQQIEQNILILVFVGIAYSIKLFLNIRNFYVKVLTNSDLNEISDPILLDVKIRTYNLLSKTTEDKKSELLLASLLKIHYDKCKEVKCHCKIRNKLYDPKGRQQGDNKIQFHKDKVFVKFYIYKMIAEGE